METVFFLELLFDDHNFYDNHNIFCIKFMNNIFYYLKRMKFLFNISRSLLF